MLVVGSILSQSATIVGLIAGAIAVGGFIGHAEPSLSGKSEEKLRRATTIGGPVGLAAAALAIALSVSVG
jgi:hypothetical protein